jgi:hypothetical protein
MYQVDAAFPHAPANFKCFNAVESIDVSRVSGNRSSHVPVKPSPQADDS